MAQRGLYIWKYVVCALNAWFRTPKFAIYAKGNTKWQAETVYSEYKKKKKKLRIFAFIAVFIWRDIKWTCVVWNSFRYIGPARRFSVPFENEAENDIWLNLFGVELCQRTSESLHNLIVMTFVLEWAVWLLYRLHWLISKEALELRVHNKASFSRAFVHHRASFQFEWIAL